MNQKYSQRVVFLAVYITEAHAKDEWPCGKTLSFCEQPKSTEQRRKLALIAQQKIQIKFPMLVDTIENDFEKSYASWPFRFYGFSHGKLDFKAQPDMHRYAYDIQTLEEWIERNF